MTPHSCLPLPFITRLCPCEWMWCTYYVSLDPIETYLNIPWYDHADCWWSKCWRLTRTRLTGVSLIASKQSWILETTFPSGYPASHGALAKVSGKLTWHNTTEGTVMYSCWWRKCMNACWHDKCITMYVKYSQGFTMHCLIFLHNLTSHSSEGCRVSISRQQNLPPSWRGAAE